MDIEFKLEIAKAQGQISSWELGFTLDVYGIADKSAKQQALFDKIMDKVKPLEGEPNLIKVDQNSMWGTYKFVDRTKAVDLGVALCEERDRETHLSFVSYYVPTSIERAIAEGEAYLDHSGEVVKIDKDGYVTEYKVRNRTYSTLSRSRKSYVERGENIAPPLLKIV